MASRLFHAVVGVGISLGSVSACGVTTSDDATGFDLPDASAPEASAEDAAAPVVDAAPPDAATDVPMDAIVAAFCDATWPITKSGREVCGPADECTGQTIPWCFGPDGQGSCKLYPLQCVGAEWHCMGGATPTDNPGPPPTCQ